LFITNVFYLHNVGLINNVSLLRDVVTHPNFITGDITTKFFEEHYPDGFKGMILPHLFIK
jgi:acetyl/propionyl-CoA carboxylase alpha subunit